MVEMMEAWFHADKDVLRAFYGDGFKVQAMAGNPNVETIPKKDLEQGLKEATRQTRKGSYHKIRHAPALLAGIDARRVRAAAPNCQRIFEKVLTAPA